MAQFTDPVLLSRERNRDEFSMTRSTQLCPRRESISSWKGDYNQPTPTTFGTAEFATKSPLEYEPQKAKNEPRTLPQAGDYGLNHRNSVETIETTEVTFAFRTSVGVDDFGASFIDIIGTSLDAGWLCHARRSTAPPQTRSMKHEMSHSAREKMTMPLAGSTISAELGKPCMAGPPAKTLPPLPEAAGLTQLS